MKNTQMGDLKKCVLKMDMTKSLAHEDQNVQHGK